jgi:hypothetical protein
MMCDSVYMIEKSERYALLLEFLDELTIALTFEKFYQPHLNS